MATEERLAKIRSLIHHYQKDVPWLLEQLDQRSGQIDTLASFIMQEVEGEPSESQGAVDTAIRIITQLQERVRELEAAGKCLCCRQSGCQEACLCTRTEAR